MTLQELIVHLEDQSEDCQNFRDWADEPDSVDALLSYLRELARLRRELAEMTAKARIDEQQCDDMTKLAADAVARAERAEAALDETSAILTKYHPIGAVKAVGRMEVAKATEETCVAARALARECEAWEKAAKNVMRSAKVEAARKVVNDRNALRWAKENHADGRTA